MCPCDSETPHFIKRGLEFRALSTLYRRGLGSEWTEDGRQVMSSKDTRHLEPNWSVVPPFHHRYPTSSVLETN